MFKKLLQKLAHLTRNNGGEIETWWENGTLMVGFRCHGCKKLQGITDTGIKSNPDISTESWSSSEIDNL